MKKTFILVMISFTCFMGVNLKAQSLAEILSAHTKVMGYEKLAAVKTIIITGDRHFGEHTVPFKTIIKNPNKYYNERSFRGRKTMQVYDGDKAWALSPMSGVSQIYGKQLKMLKQNADIGGLLYQWKENGLKVSLNGNEAFDGKNLIKLKVENIAGEISEIYLDAESFMTIKQITKRTFQDKIITVTVVFSNYKIIDGIAVAFNTETTSDTLAEDGRGMGEGTKVIKSVEFNKEVDDAIFAKPETKR